MYKFERSNIYSEETLFSEAIMKQSYRWDNIWIKVWSAVLEISYISRDAPYIALYYNHTRVLVYGCTWRYYHGVNF